MPEYSADDRARDHARMEFKEAAIYLVDEGYGFDELLAVLTEVEAIEDEAERAHKFVTGP